MLNIGIIGITELLEPHVKEMQKNKQVNVIGKASIGRSAQLNSFHFSIPEFNRVELIERADILIIDSSSMLPFDLLCETLKKGKHVFTIGYPDLSVDECDSLIKLADESGSVFHISNKDYYEKGFEWLRENKKIPVFIDILKDSSSGQQKEEILSLLLLLNGITNLEFKRLTVTAFDSQNNEVSFLNIRMDFGNASAVNITVKSVAEPESFLLKFYSVNQFGTYDVRSNELVLNGEKIEDLDGRVASDFDCFVSAIHENVMGCVDLEVFKMALLAYKSIKKKMDLFVM